MIRLSKNERGVKSELNIVAAGVQLLPTPRAGAIQVRFPKGSPVVPPWLQVSTKPASFGAPVEVVGERISDPDRAAFARMGYRDVPETRLCVRATASFAVGDCLIRYKAGSRVLFAATQPYQGKIWWSKFSDPPGTWMWTEDGPDMLLFARVAEPDFRIVNSRLAKRVVHPAKRGVA